MYFSLCADRRLLRERRTKANHDLPPSDAVDLTVTLILDRILCFKRAPYNRNTSITAMVRPSHQIHISLLEYAARNVDRAEPLAVMKFKTGEVDDILDEVRHGREVGRLALVLV